MLSRRKAGTKFVNLPVKKLTVHDVQTDIMI